MGDENDKYLNNKYTAILKCEFRLGTEVYHAVYGIGNIISINTLKRGAQYVSMYEVLFEQNLVEWVKEDEIIS